jgi:hypothetical protein
MLAEAVGICRIIYPIFPHPTESVSTCVSKLCIQNVAEWLYTTGLIYSSKLYFAQREIIENDYRRNHLRQDIVILKGEK